MLLFNRLKYIQMKINKIFFIGLLFSVAFVACTDLEEELREDSMPTTRLYTAVRLVFTVYKEKPNAKAIDACKLTDCY